MNGGAMAETSVMLCDYRAAPIEGLVATKRKNGGTKEEE